MNIADIGKLFSVVKKSTIAIACGVALASSGCAATDPALGGSKGNTVTGGAGGASSQGSNSALEHCDNTLGTLAMYEDTDAPWWHELRDHQLGSTLPVLRVMIQQSNCFMIVERGKMMKNISQERAIQESGEGRAGSHYGKGQVASADYTMSPEITFSAKGTQGGGGAAAIGGLLGGVGHAVGAIAGGFSANEASTTLLLVDNRSSIQISAATGSAKNFDFMGFGGGILGSLGAAGGGYSNTPQGKVIVAAFADSYNQMVKALRNYKAQEVKGGAGTGGTLGVQGGSTPASKELQGTPAATKETQAPATKEPATKEPATKKKKKAKAPAASDASGDSAPAGK